ncbi:MAG: tRNA (N6-threonylcarbamoyladenosine(37)-N6)-methyltransferase TrmO, partial [Polyangiaceae bacterium]|nr:tRNA (N6-threonylcarbamoyladenosine(37)-N6)-methyltransferase TrmO [Polyangiaceae bacterium]
AGPRDAGPLDAGPLDAGPRDPGPSFEVAWTRAAEEELAFVEAAGVRLREPVTARLALGPQPHAYRRITLSGDTGRLAYKDWRISFRVSERRIEVTGLATGYRPRELATSPEPALELHRRFAARFGR